MNGKRRRSTGRRELERLLRERGLTAHTNGQRHTSDRENPALRQASNDATPDAVPFVPLEDWPDISPFEPVEDWMDSVTREMGPWMNDVARKAKPFMDKVVEEASPLIDAMAERVARDFEEMGL